MSNVPLRLLFGWRALLWAVCVGATWAAASVFGEQLYLWWTTLRALDLNPLELSGVSIVRSVLTGTIVFSVLLYLFAPAVAWTLRYTKRPMVVSCTILAFAWSAFLWLLAWYGGGPFFSYTETTLALLLEAVLKSMAGALPATYWGQGLARRMAEPNLASFD